MMMVESNNLIIFLISFASSIFLTWMLIRVMTHYEIVDKPSKRRAHLDVVPRGAGLALMIIFTLFCIFNQTLSSSNIIQLFIPISLISFWDDISKIAVPFRLFIHILCALLAIIWFIQPRSLLHYEVNLYIDLAITTLAFIAFINIYNFMDGIDGITATQSIHLAITILLLCYLKSDIITHLNFIIITNLILLGFALGFIIFNWSPAKIFIGDVGTISLGFLFGLCLLMLACDSERLFASCVIASLYYIIDGGLTILIRLINKEKIWTPHLNHFFQKAIRRGWTHQEVVTNIIICNFCLMILSIGALYYPIISIALAFIVITITLTIFAQKRHK